MATQVTMEDGTESPLEDHMRDAHQKGTRGFTEECLDTMHRALHQRKREPEEELEHRHPDAAGEGARAGSAQRPGSGAMDSRHSGSEVPRTSEAANGGYRDRQEREPSQAFNASNRDREEQGMSGSMKTKHRDKRNPEAANGGHRDRYQQHTADIPDQRSGEPRNAHGFDVPSSDNVDRDRDNVDRDNVDRDRDRDSEEQLAPAGGHQRTGKHRKHRR